MDMISYQEKLKPLGADWKNKNMNEFHLMAKMTEEAGEVADALFKRDENRLKEELLDLISFAIMMANYHGIVLDDDGINKNIEKFYQKAEKYKK